jgi:hypothetical protein
MCIGEMGKVIMEGGFYWTFWFDVPTYRALETYVQSQKPEVNTNVHGLDYRFGTFAVTWRKPRSENKYVLLPDAACSYFSAVNRICAKGQNPGCTRVIDNLMSRLACA